MATQPLIKVSCISKGEKIGLTNYSDLVVFDKDKTIVALRFGGYPKSVQAMSDIVVTGCDLELQGARETLKLNSKGQKKYERRFSHDGVYAEAMHYLKDDVPNTIMLGDDESGGTKVAVKKNLYFFCNNQDELFAELDRKLSIPLIPEFKDYFISELQNRNILQRLTVYSLGRKFEAWHMKISEDEKEVAEVLENGLKTGKISIPGTQKGNLSVFKNIGTFTQYLHEFGAMIADRIKKCFPPRFNPAEETVAPEITEVNDCVRTHAGYSLFDAQLGAAEALKRQLETDKMALLVAECGTGKTKIGSAALYAYQHGNPKRKVYNKAFNVVICPSHITGKWVREIHETIPNSYAMHVTTMSEVDNLYSYYLKENKSVYCILSKETARNGYMRKPSVIWNPIKRGFVCPHVYYGTKRPEYPVNAENLASDLFTALFSPVIRKKDTDYVKPRERYFNKPILDRILTDDRFDTLKKLCEDKEITSYEAASTFAKKLNDLLESKPFQTKVRYIFIIDQLNEQISKTVEKIQQNKNNPQTNAADKLLPLYERIHKKLTQIANLEAKLMEDALCYMQNIGSDINDALETAVERTVEVNCIMTAWGTDSGEMKNTPTNKELLEHVKKSEELLRIARTLGKYKELITDKRKNGFAYGRGEKYDLTIGNDISNCLSSELALLGTPETEILFMRKYEQKRLAQYRKRTEIIKGKGDMIVLVDESSSTREVQAWAKAFALAMLDIAAKDNRKFAMVHFASADDVKTDLFEPGHYTSADVISAAEKFFGGSTDFETPLTEAINLMEKGYENADITIITDGECRISDEFAEKFRNTMAKYKASVTGILLDKDRPCGKTLEPFCDKIYHSKDITEDEIALRILNKKIHNA